MGINRIIQSVLFALVILGVFAAMAKNAYGFDFIGIACLGLSLLFLVQLIWKFVNEYGSLGRADLPELAELVLLSLLTFLFGLRAFYIYVDFGEMIFNAVCLLQVILYSVIGYREVTNARKGSKLLAQKVIFFYASLLLFLLSITIRTNTTGSIAVGALALLVAIPFIISIAAGKKYEVGVKGVSLLQFIVVSKNKAGLLFLFFISSAFFTGLSYFNIIPSIENVERPKDYIELINQAETGKEKPVDGKYRHERYKEAMDAFLKRHDKK
jgi:hypothetical protein